MDIDMKNGFTCSAFDFLHPGHITMLAECKKNCDWLIVGLHTDPTIDRPTTKQKPVQSVFERYLMLRHCKYVDEIIPYETEKDLCNMLSILDIHVRFLGEEYRNIEATGQQICKGRDISIIYLPRKHTYSSTDLRNRINGTH
jgi:glycerol-3-phosphate cytidylyltransferase